MEAYSRVSFPPNTLKFTSRVLRINSEVWVISPLVSFMPTMFSTSWARRSTRPADMVYPTLPGLLYSSMGVWGTASAMVLKWRNSSRSVGFKNIG